MPGWETLKNDGLQWSRKYLAQKWGCVDEEITLKKCKYKRPFNDSKFQLSYWVKNQRRIDRMLRQLGVYNRTNRGHSYIHISQTM